MTAWDLVRRGTWHFHQVTRENHIKARELFREACRLDSEVPEAHLWLGRVSAGVVAYGWSDRPAADLQEGMKAALRAIHLDERNPYAHYALAIVSVYAERFEQAISAARKAIEISPSFALGHLVLGMALLFSGRASEAIAPLEYGLRLSPYDPTEFRLVQCACARASVRGTVGSCTRSGGARPSGSAKMVDQLGSSNVVAMPR